MKETDIIICLKKKSKLKEYQRNCGEAKKSTQFFYLYFLYCIRMRKELIFNNGHNNYTIDKHYFQKDKKPININEVDTKK